MPKKIISTFVKRKRKSHPHSKNLSRLKTSKQYKKPYRGQGR
jgi:hypothetical protein|tara:strand:- start:2434 stop:2559 length:126 start_codon:yes stop_codon:yes gene_type:complete